MIKKGIKQAVSGFCCAVAINTILWVIFMMVIGFVPLVPDYAARFESEAEAIVIQLMLVGLMSAVFSGGTVIMELPKLSLLTQSILYFVVTTIVWIPVGWFCFGLGIYKTTLISFGLSYLVSYIICWTIQYRICKRSVEEINDRLLQLRQEEII